MIIKNIHYIGSIPSVPKREMILLRLGYKKNTTTLSEEQEKFLESGIRSALSLCRLSGVYGRFAIVERSESHIKLENGKKFESASLAKLLSNSDEVMLMASTAGKTIVDRIRSEVITGNAALGVIMDSTASQAADAALGWLMEFINKTIRREGCKLTKHRYSPGYGDLLLINQKIIYDMLELSKYGVELTEKYMLVPEKSVLAIAGIERIEAYE